MNRKNYNHPNTPAQIKRRAKSIINRSFDWKEYPTDLEPFVIEMLNLAYTPKEISKMLSQVIRSIKKNVTHHYEVVYQAKERTLEEVLDEDFLDEQG